MSELVDGVHLNIDAMPDYLRTIQHAVLSAEQILNCKYNFSYVIFQMPKRPSNKPKPSASMVASSTRPSRSKAAAQRRNISPTASTDAETSLSAMHKELLAVKAQLSLISHASSSRHVHPSSSTSLVSTSAITSPQSASDLTSPSTSGSSMPNHSSTLPDPVAILLDMATTPNDEDQDHSPNLPEGMSYSTNITPSHLRNTQSALGAPSVSSFPVSSSNSNPIPLGSSIEPKLKARIIKGLYVPMDVILVSEQGGNIDHYLRNTTLTPGNDSRNRTFYPTLNIDRWADGFLVFAAIWGSAFPQDHLVMLQYIHLIRSMAKNTPGPLWLAYDREFRIRRQTDANLPWDSLHPQLYFQLIARHSPLPRMDTYFSSPSFQTIPDSDFRPPVKQTGQTAEARNIFKRGFCTHFNLHGSCRRLVKCQSLAHRCSLCDAPTHPAVKCKLYSPPQSTQPTTPKTKQPPTSR